MGSIFLLFLLFARFVTTVVSASMETTSSLPFAGDTLEKQVTVQVQITFVGAAELGDDESSCFQDKAGTWHDDYILGIVGARRLRRFLPEFSGVINMQSTIRIVNQNVVGYANTLAYTHVMRYTANSNENLTPTELALLPYRDDDAVQDLISSLKKDVTAFDGLSSIQRPQLIQAANDSCDSEENSCRHLFFDGSTMKRTRFRALCVSRCIPNFFVWLRLRLGWTCGECFERN